MITAVDSSVLLDVFAADARFMLRSREALRSCLAEGHLVACEVVWAELAALFAAPDAAADAMETAGVAFSPMSLEAVLTASVAWRGYRSHGGKRTRVVADFLIGAHALTQAERLLTRDRGFYRSYFKDLSILEPGKNST